MSSGATVRRSITSTEMPSPASCSAAATASCTIRDTDTTVMSVPGAHDDRPADRDDVVGRRLRSLHAVEQPVLDEDDRVRVLDRGAQQPVGVGRRRRHDDGQPGDVREQRFEALRVLAARRAPGAELRPHGQRHLRGAAGHERQLRGLVEQLVEADADEVEVHQLDDRAHARHRRADAEADDRALGDRRVADAIAEAVVQPARQAEHVAAGARRRSRRRTRARRSRARLRARSRIASIVRNTGASAAGAGGSARSGRGRVTKSVSVAAAGARQLPRRVDRVVELAARPPPASTSSASSVTPADRSRRACTSSGSRASHSRTSSGDR